MSDNDCLSDRMKKWIQPINKETRDIKECIRLLLKDIKRLSHDEVIHLEVLTDIIKDRFGEELI